MSFLVSIGDLCVEQHVAKAFLILKLTNLYDHFFNHIPIQEQICQYF